ncbi:serine/threonine-protein kinase [Streptomyces griseus]|uniref:serine/threonine-protein kinase n=1 Tax=Streptomyces griseus TaxID=1911 RepID=UPI00056A2F15|nr:serine/threonine-protein kinase [Streptomyces griseus]
MGALGPGDPRHIGTYRLLARLGAGGMGHVFLARSERGRTVAVKLVRAELAAEEEFRARFRREVRAARRVGGSWTAPVLDADTEAAVPWVATGYIAGPSLQQVVGHDHGPLPERTVRILATGLAHALTDIHAAGIVHRDLKPSNVLVTIDGPRVIDFGIARALETVTDGAVETVMDGGLTHTGAMIGSPGFMAPEQVLGEPITPACDVFCLGSLLAYAATGRLPFGSADSGAHALMFRIAEKEPDLTGVPEGIADLVRACLRKDPAARPSLTRVLERTGAQDTAADGRFREPWLPSALVAQLGRHAVRLLEVEGPERGSAEGRRPEGGGASEAAGGVRHAPEATPEHAPASDDITIPGREAAPGEPGGNGHPQQPAIGAWNDPPAPADAWNPPPYPPYVLTTPYPAIDHGPAETLEPPRRNGRSTALLVVVALVVALAAGGSVYALMNGDTTRVPDPGTSSRTATAPTSPEPTTPTPSSTPSSTPTDAAVPTAYLGTWTATIDSAGGSNTRQLTIEQGGVGDTVLTLVADGTTEGGGYHCEFEATLAEKPSPGGPLSIGPSTVTSGEPRSSCNPGAPTEITLLPDGRLQRTSPGTGEKLTYTRR